MKNATAIRAPGWNGKQDVPIRWQQQKSARTRLAMLDAGIDCLVERGYGGLSASLVAERAGVSRGAMHHHFATRLELVAGLVDHVFHKRLADFLDGYARAVAEHGEDGLIEIGSDLHWRSVETREYAAYLELTVAARTDPELAQLLEPALARYDALWRQEMMRFFPQWERDWEAMQIANDFTIAAHLGLLLQRPAFGEERVERVRRLVREVNRRLHDAP
ncbi:TetR family transcriptional regulator [Sphingomonas sp. Root710]|uniref:TetR/AcrR family transcriptional regulator n=1 Tax=Sphingomonas sp. Root710 TaxID=1736594 RepID=UPI0006F7B94F|nr:TetR/AcrR family transcriptional regulator [Sphingomonas sp. Root710]KRB86761.1 TetR family transcriptional regulator [Sphingomonas sp. Root710]